MPMHVAMMSVPTYSMQLCQNPHQSIRTSASGDRPVDAPDDLVITPGGPRSREKVHQVPPGHTVRQNADGTYEVVPNDAPASPEPKDGRKD
jgi:hypothetical protein